MRFPSLRLLMLGLSGSVIVLVAAYSGILALWRASDLDAFLPAEETVAYFHRVGTEGRRHWSDRFPQLRSIPVLGPRMDIGIVQGGAEGDAGWIASPVPYRDFAESNTVIGRQRALTSFAGRSPLIHPRTGDAQRKPLRESSTYQTLTQGLGNEAEWIYFPRGNADEFLPLRVRKFLRAFIAADGPLLLVLDGPMVSIRFHGQPTPLRDATASSLPILSPAPELSISLGNVREVLDQYLLANGQEQRPIIEGLLLKEAEKLLGGEWSLQHDLLPMTAGRGTVHASMGKDGAMILFEGKMSAPAAIKERLNAFHDQFRSKILGAAVVERALDYGIVSRAIQSDPAQTEDTTTRERGWTVRVTRSRDGKLMLMSAWNEQRFLIGNAPEWLEQLTVSSPDAMLPQLRKPLIAGGKIGRAQFGALTSGFSSPLWTMADASLGDAQDVLWSVEADDAVTTLSIAPH